MSPPKILFIASVPYPTGWAASARIRNLVAGFEASHWHVDICLFGRPAAEAIESYGNNISWCFPDVRGGRLGRQYAYYVAPRRLAYQIQTKSVYQTYECVYLYARAYSVVAPLIAAFQGIGVRVIVDVNEAHSHFSGLGGALSPNFWNSYFGYRHAIPRADLIACISEELSNFYRDIGANTFLLPSVEFYDQRPEKNRLGRTKFLYSGSFYERDYADLMLSIVEGLLQRGVPLDFVITGPYESSPNAEKYLKRIESSDCLRENTRLLGRVPESEYLEIKRTIDFGFILRRNHHAERASFPTRLVEFIREGIIPVTTSVPDVPNYLSHGLNSVFTESQGIDATVEYLVKVCENSDEMNRLRDNAFDAGKLHFCAKKNVARLIDYLDG